MLETTIKIFPRKHHLEFKYDYTKGAITHPMTNTPTHRMTPSHPMSG